MPEVNFMAYPILITQLLGLAIWLFLSAPVFAQTIPADSQSKPTGSLSIDTSDSLQKGSLTPKISQDLMTIYKNYQVHKQEGSRGQGKEETPGQSTLQISDGFVVIDAIASKNAGTLKTDLEALGLKKSALFGRVVSGLFPIPEIPKLSTLKSLKFARASLAKTHNIPGSAKGTR